MCSIMGYCSRSISFYDFMKGFEKTKSRGPDDSRVVKTEKGILGFHRLSNHGADPVWYAAVSVWKKLCSL